MRRHLLFAVAVFAAPWAVSAEEVSTNQVTPIPPIIITGTRIPEMLDTTPTAVTVLPREDIDAQQQRTVADALRVVPGLDVVRSGQPGGQTSVFLRGANANQTLVLIDGVRVNNPFNNAFDFVNLPVDNIDHIEVLRGPQSTLYGSEALGGVINIVTRQCVGKPTGAVTVEGGSDDSLRATGSFAGNFEKLYLSAESSYFTTDNERVNSYDRVGNATGRATYQVLDRLTVSLLATYLDSKAGSPNDRFTNDPNDFLHNENTLVALTFDGAPAAWWHATLTLSHSHERGFFDAPPNTTNDFPYAEFTVTDRDQVDFQNIFTIANGHRLLVGGTYDHNGIADDNTYNALHRNLDDQAAYAQYEFAALPRFTATAGGRVDDYNSFGAHGTYRFGGRFTTPVTETILRASVGTGFRAPTPGQLYSPSPFEPGNPNLRPEESLGWDAGVEQPLLAGKLAVGATYFQNQFDNLIGRVSTTNVLVNIDRARTAGAETFATWTPWRTLTVRGSYTWLADAQDGTTGERLLRRPEHTGSLSATYRFLERFTASANTTFVGPRVDAFFDQTTFQLKRVTNTGYVKVDLGLSCEVGKHFTVFGRVENLLDDRYKEIFGFPALGRTFWGGATAKF